MENLDARALVAVGIAMLTFAAGWGVIVAQIRGIHHRLDKMNSSIEKHSTKLYEHGSRISHIEGRQEHP